MPDRSSAKTTPLGMAVLPPPLERRRLPHLILFSRLNYTASRLAVYASCRHFGRRFRRLVTPYRAGVLTRWVPIETFRRSILSFLFFSFRFVRTPSPSHRTWLAPSRVKTTRILRLRAPRLKPISSVAAGHRSSATNREARAGRQKRACRFVGRRATIASLPEHGRPVGKGNVIFSRKRSYRPWVGHDDVEADQSSDGCVRRSM